MSVARQFWSGFERSQHSKNAEDAMRCARELVGVEVEEWAVMVAVQVWRPITVDDIKGWESGLGFVAPGDVLMAAAYLSKTPIHELIGSAEFVRQAVDLEARMDRLDHRP